MRLSVKIGLVVILLSIVTAVLFFTGIIGGSLYGKGSKIEIDGENTVEIDGLKFTINNGGYFKGDLKDITENVAGEEALGSFIILDVELENKLQSINKLQGLSVYTKTGRPLGTAMFVYSDEKLPYSMDKELIRDYKLLPTGDGLLAGEKRRGAIYIATDLIEDKEFILTLEASTNIEFNVKITNEKYKAKDLEEVKVIRSVEEESIEVGDLKEGKVIEFENEENVLKVEDLEINFGAVTFFEELPEEFANELMHMSAVNGTEKLLMVDVNIKNLSDKEVHVGDFLLYETDAGSESELGTVEESEGLPEDAIINGEIGGIQAIRTVAADVVGNGVVNKEFMEKYGLLNYPGFGPDTEALGAKSSISGKIIFYTRSLEVDNYYLGYKGLNEESDERVKLIIR